MAQGEQNSLDELQSDHELQWTRGNMIREEDDTKFSGSEDILLSPELIHLETPYQFFRFFWTKEVIEEIRKQTILYSVQQRPERPIVLDNTEIEAFLSIMMWMGLVRMSSQDMYWNEEVHFRPISELMSSKRFKEIKRFLHFNDNSLEVVRGEPGYDKLHKVRPLLNMLRARMLLVPKEEHLSIDEQVVPFKGRSSLKLYNKNKPHKWGYKIYVLSGVSGQIYDFEVHSGHESQTLDTTLSEIECGKSGNVVVRLLRTVPRQMNYKIYYDNWFTNCDLQLYLLSQGILSVGTVRPNRVSGNGLV